MTSRASCRAARGVKILRGRFTAAPGRGAARVHSNSADCTDDILPSGIALLPNASYE